MNRGFIDPSVSCYQSRDGSGDVAMTTDSVLQGYLHKSPPLGKRGLKIWHKRWVVLRDDRKLYYYRSQRTAELLGVIDISSCIRLDCGLDHKKYRHIFAIVCKDRTHFFSAASESGMEEWVSAICRMRSTEYGWSEAFRPVWKPSRHSLETTVGNEGEDNATSQSLVRMFKKSWSVLSPKRTHLSREKRRLSVDTDRQGSETPPPVDRSSKPPPPVHRHLKPVSFQSLSPLGSDSALSSASVLSSSVESEVFKFPAVDAHHHQTRHPSASPSPGEHRPQLMSSDSAIDVRKSADDLSPAWRSSDRSPQDSPAVQRASNLSGSRLFQAESVTSIDQLSPVLGSSCDSGAESEDGETEEPVSTRNTRTFHYALSRTDNTTDEDLSDSDSPSKGQWRSAVVDRLIEDSNVHETEV